MGVFKLAEILHEKELFEHADLSGHIVGIDGESFLQNLHKKLKNPNDYEQLDVAAATFIDTLRRHDITPIVVFDEVVNFQEHELKSLLKKCRNDRLDVRDFLIYWQRQIYMKNKKFPLRKLTKYQLIDTIKAEQVEIRFASGNAHYLLQKMLIDGKIQHVMSDDSSAIAHSSPEMSWCRLSTLTLPFGDVVTQKEILERYGLDSSTFVRCCLWMGSDVTSPHFTKIIRKKYGIPDHWDAIVEWVIEKNDTPVLEIITETNEALMKVWKKGMENLCSTSVPRPFDGIVGSSGFKLQKEVIGEAWRVVHQKSHKVIWPIQNLFMNILGVSQVLVHCSERTLKRESIMEGLEEKFKDKAATFPIFLAWYLETMTKALQLKDIEPFVWDVWIEEIWFYYFQCKSQVEKKYIFKAPKSFCQMMESDDFNIPETSTLKEKAVAKQREKGDLPIVKFKEQILTTIEKERISMVCASTGSGKSSMIPQWLIDDKRTNNILVTQPRRMATSGIAHYVSKCRGETVGSTIGYKVGHGGGRVSSQTRLLFCTTGYITERITHDPDYLKRFSHVCLDEVHERSLDMDLLLRLIKVNAKVYEYKIVLMSATLNTDSLKDYFHVKCEPVMIETQIFPIEISYLEDIERKYGNMIRDGRFRDNLRSLSRVSNKSANITSSTNYMQTALITEILKYCSNKGKSTLVFCSGISLITDISSKIQEFQSPFYRVRILHSAVPLENDDDLLPDPNMYNIYLASDVAESSITLVDCDFVIDCCMQREVCTEKDRSILRSIWASKDSLKQRKGRTGRVCAGRCFRLISKTLYEDLRPTGKPEILKMLPLELTYKLKKSTNDAIIPILEELPTIPDITQIEESIDTLFQLGILTGIFDEDSVLTPMGHLMKDIPMELRASQIVMVGLALNCPVDAIILACFLSLDHDPFRGAKIIYFKDTQSFAETINKLVRWKLHFSNGSESEAIGYLNLFRAYAQFRAEGRRSQHEIRKWCDEHMVVKSRLNLWWHRTKSVAQSISDDFEGKAWLIGESKELPPTLASEEVRIFMLCFNSWHPFKWNNSDKIKLQSIPLGVTNERVQDRLIKVLYPNTRLGTEDNPMKDSANSASSKRTPKTKANLKEEEVESKVGILDDLEEMFKRWIRTKQNNSEQINIQSSKLYRKLLPHVQTQGRSTHVYVEPLSEDSGNLQYEQLRVQIATPYCKLEDGSTQLIIDTEFAWEKTEAGWLTFLGANYVGNNAFGMGITVLRNIDVKAWDKLMSNEDGEFFQRLDHVRRTANEDKTLLAELHREVKALFIAPPGDDDMPSKKKKKKKQKSSSQNVGNRSQQNVGNRSQRNSRPQVKRNNSRNLAEHVSSSYGDDMGSIFSPEFLARTEQWAKRSPDQRNQSSRRNDDRSRKNQDSGKKKQKGRNQINANENSSNVKRRNSKRGRGNRRRGRGRGRGNQG